MAYLDKYIAIGKYRSPKRGCVRVEPGDYVIQLSKKDSATIKGEVTSSGIKRVYSGIPREILKAINYEDNKNR